MTILGLSGNAAHVKITNKNEARTDPPAITAIVRNRADTPDFRNSNSSMDHALSFPPGGEVVSIGGWCWGAAKMMTADTMVCGENPLVRPKRPKGNALFSPYVWTFVWEGESLRKTSWLVQTLHRQIQRKRVVTVPTSAWVYKPKPNMGLDLMYVGTPTLFVSLNCLSVFCNLLFPKQDPHLRQVSTNKR